MAGHTLMHFNIGIFGFPSDSMHTELIKSISSLFHEARLRVADIIGPDSENDDGDVCLDVYVCPSLADEIWLQSFDSEDDTVIHCVNLEKQDENSPIAKGASSVINLGGGGTFNETHTMVQYIAAQSDMVIGLWDGDDRSRSGMILSLLRLEVKSGIPCAYIDTRNPEEMYFFDRYASEPFSSVRLKEYIDALYACGHEKEFAPLGKPAFLSRLWEVCYDRFIKKNNAQVKKLPFEKDILLDPEYKGQDGVPCRPNQKRLAEQFHFFDGIAVQTAKKYRESIYFRSILPFYLTVAISIGFYVETLFGILYKFQGGLDYWMFVAGIGFLLHALINVYGDYVYRCKEVKERHWVFMRSRYLAEYMRVAVHFLPFGIPMYPESVQDKSLSAHVRRIFRSLEPTAGSYSQDAAKAVVTNSLLLINDQITYHTNTRSRLKLVVEKLEKNGKRLLWAGFAIVFVRGLLQFAMPFLTSIIQGEHNGIKWINFIRSLSNMLALIIPAWAGYFSLKLSLNNFRGLFNHSDDAIKKLDRLKGKAEMLANSSKIPYEMLSALSQDILKTQLDEVNDWYMQTGARTVTRL